MNRHFVATVQICAMLFILNVQLGSVSATELVVLVGEHGEVTAVVSFDNPLATQSGGLSTPSTGIFLVAVPFQKWERWTIKVADDIRVAPLSNGHGYSILAVLAPVSLPKVRIEIGNGMELSKTQEGKWKIEFNLSYPYLSQPERELLQFKSSLSVWDTSVILPRDYDAAEVSYSANLTDRINPHTFVTSSSRVASSHNGSVWVVFPNPFKQGLLYLNIASVFAVGFLTGLAQLSAIRERSLFLLLVSLVASLAIDGAIIYYALIVAKLKSLDFLVWAAGPLAHAGVTCIATLFVLLAKRWQAMLSGLVTIDSHPAEFADVRLWKINGNTQLPTPVAQTRRLKQGRYTFPIWMRQGRKEYQVSAGAKNTETQTSSTFAVTPREHYELPPINLLRIVP